MTYNSTKRGCLRTNYLLLYWIRTKRRDESLNELCHLVLELIMPTKIQFEIHLGKHVYETFFSFAVENIF